MLYPLCLFWFIFLEGNWPTPTWTVWSSCSVTCGIGKRERTRSCDMPITEAVKYRCFEKDTETEKCSQLPCTGTYKKINKSRRCRNRCSETGYFFIKYIKTVVSWIFILQNNVSSHTFKRLSCINFFFNFTNSSERQQFITFISTSVLCISLLLLGFLFVFLLVFFLIKKISFRNLWTSNYNSFFK